MAPVIVTPVELPTSKASVLCPNESPSALSIVISVTASVDAPLIDISWTGEFLNDNPVMVEVVKLWA